MSKFILNLLNIKSDIFEATPDSMKKVIIASLNPVKISCVENTFKSAFPGETFDFKGVSVPSGVSEQPMSNSETYLGAYNRAKNAQKSGADGDFYVGIEGGIEKDEMGMNAFAWIVILSSNQKGESKTATFCLPQAIVELIDQGMELGHADDRVFKRNNSKQKDGAIGILSHGLIDRTRYYEQAVTMALIPFMNTDLY